MRPFQMSVLCRFHFLARRLPLLSGRSQMRRDDPWLVQLVRRNAVSVYFLYSPFLLFLVVGCLGE